jgi:hypothetical protein
VKSAKIAREYESTITKPESGRTPRPIRIEPKEPQSTWASSAASVVSRRYTAAVAAGRIRRTARRSCTTEPV